jgi:hypothetical protein
MNKTTESHSAIRFVHCLKIQDGHIHRHFVEKTYFSNDTISFTALFAKGAWELHWEYKVNEHDEESGDTRYYTLWGFCAGHKARIERKGFNLNEDRDKRRFHTLFNRVVSLTTSNTTVVILQYAGVSRRELISISPDSMFLTEHRKHCSQSLLNWAENAMQQQSIMNQGGDDDVSEIDDLGPSVAEPLPSDLEDSD